MKLLFDANVSQKLLEGLAPEFAGSAHVRHVGLLTLEDGEIWNYARTNGFAVVSKDTDFRERSYVEGFPPKIIWLDVGNAGTMVIAQLLRAEHQRILRFGEHEETSLLILSLETNAV